MNDSLSWLPNYRIKKHKRAKYVKLRASHSHGLEVTIPFRFNLRNLPSILEENKDWILKQFHKLQTVDKEERPNQIILYSVNETWIVKYVSCHARLELIERQDKELIFVGKVDNLQLCQRKLMTWLKLKAKHYLTNLLQEISDLTKLSYDNLTIRDQRTLWGSCTSKKNISLNYKLLFLPHHLVKHVIIHELCHTQFLNHSEKFWHLVAKYDVNWHENRQSLRKANHFIPGFLR